MNKVENVESFSNDSKPLEMMSEEEKNTPSEMYPDKNSAEHGEADPDKKASEEKPEPEAETPEEEPKEGEEPKPKVEELEQEKEETPTPEPTPKSSNNAEDREAQGLSAEKDKQLAKLREDIVNLRAQRRQLKQTPSQEPTSQPTDVEGIDPEIAEQLDTYMQKKGYVPESQIREKIHNENLIKGMNNADNKFYEKYPEYLFSPDMRNEFDGIIDSYPTNPADIEEYQRRLDFAHNQVKSKHLDRFPSSSGTDTAKKQEALKNASMGAGSQSAPSSSQPGLDPHKVDEAKRFYKGFTDEEIEGFLKQK
jgi:hypothetical protein